VTDHLEQVAELGLGELATTMGIELTAATGEQVAGRMPVAGNRQPFGLLHGGANVVLAETLGSIAAALHAGPDHYPVGIEVGATHHRAATDGHVHGVATAISAGRTLATYEIVVTDDQGRRTCTARLTCLIRPRP
jgi:uncharacterized protein (TIGR00369 family)